MADFGVMETWCGFGSLSLLNDRLMAWRCFSLVSNPGGRYCNIKRGTVAGVKHS